MFPLVVINDGFFFLVGLEFSYIASCTRGFSSNGCTNFLPHYCDDDRDAMMRDVKDCFSYAYVVTHTFFDKFIARSTTVRTT